MAEKIATISGRMRRSDHEKKWKSPNKLTGLVFARPLDGKGAKLKC
jgi:hypothetical protein